MSFVVLGLGSNTAWGALSPTELLAKAVRRLSAFIEEIKLSSIYTTAAMYVTEQADFYNMVLTGYYKGSARSLLEQIHIVEASLGRNRAKEVRNGSRSLDIDIELFGKERIHEADLLIPHERLCERAFVLVPLLEIIEENADVTIDDIALYKAALASLHGQRVELFLKQDAFKDMVWKNMRNM